MHFEGKFRIFVEESLTPNPGVFPKEPASEPALGIRGIFCVMCTVILMNYKGLQGLPVNLEGRISIRVLVT